MSTGYVFDLKELAERLSQCQSVEQRLRYVRQELPFSLGEEEAVVFCSLVLLGQIQEGATEETIRSWIEDLLPVERFFFEMGGLIGYQGKLLELINQKSCITSSSSEARVAYRKPTGLDLAQDSLEVRQAVLAGIACLDQVVEIYPVGGAADRLRLVDEVTQESLPAACLPFLGKTLFAGLVADLQAREYLHYKLFGKQLLTPIALMTSQEKQNHAHIRRICEEAHWFGRSQEAFLFFDQPLVPLADHEGRWRYTLGKRILLRPGGHGALWKGARDQGIFAECIARGRSHLLVRQINNPLAGLDHGLSAFAGKGFLGKFSFGFASCPRRVHSAEGMNVVIERAGKERVLSSIEYCDFTRLGLEDLPAEEGSPYSLFPSNTNILFAEMASVLEAIAKEPIPGLTVNAKKIAYVDEMGREREEELCRLESMMQNIADCFPISQSYLTYNERSKTISTAKKAFQLGGSLFETPPGCFLDYQEAGYNLLKQQCGFLLEEGSFPLYFLYHPALGPLYSIIAQKLRGGIIRGGSELQLEIAELDVENLDLQGSLHIRAEQIMGHWDGEKKLVYSEQVGRCTLKNVRVRNQGIDREKEHVFWKNEIERFELCEIVLQGNSALVAEDILLEGSMRIVVPNGQQMRMRMELGKLVCQTTPLEGALTWKYTIQDSLGIHLNLSQ